MDKFLTFLAVVITTLAVTDIAGMPTWVNVVAGVLATGFAAIGIPAASPVTTSTVRNPQ